MCEHDDTIVMRLPIPATRSHTGEFRWAHKPIDRCIAPIIQGLNAAGIYTTNSCCGHGKGLGSIILHDGRELTIGQQDTSVEELRTSVCHALVLHDKGRGLMVCQVCRGSGLGGASVIHEADCAFVDLADAWPDNKMLRR